MSTEVIIALAGTGITAVALGATIFTSARQSSFLYANARVSARSCYIINDEKLSQIICANSIPEIVGMLKDTEYEPYFDAVDKTSAPSFSLALEKGLINSIFQIMEICPKKSRDIFKIYFSILESKLIKTFYRARFSNIHIDIKILEPIGQINPILFRKLQETKSTADISVSLAGTDFAELFERNFNSIEEFDVEIENKTRDIIKNMLKKIKLYDKKSISGIFEMREDVTNILSLLRLHIRGRDKRLYAGKLTVRGIDMKKLSETSDLKTFVELFENSLYEDAMKNAYADFEEYGTYYGFERELLRRYYKFVKDNELSHVIGPYPIITYITKKEIEQKNLFIILKGIMAELPKEEIKRMMI